MDFLTDASIWKYLAAIVTAVTGAIASYLTGSMKRRDSAGDRTHSTLNNALDRQMARIEALEKQIEERDRIIRKLQREIIDIQSQ